MEWWSSGVMKGLIEELSSDRSYVSKVDPTN